MESLEKIEDECSSADDKKNKELGALRGAEGSSADPFVQKKMQIQNKVNETKKVLLHAPATASSLRWRLRRRLPPYPPRRRPPPYPPPAACLSAPHPAR